MCSCVCGGGGGRGKGVNLRRFYQLKNYHCLCASVRACVCGVGGGGNVR